MNVFSEAFNAAIEAYQVKQTQVCEKTGISSGRMSEYATGKRVPGSRIQTQIASAFGLGLIDFLALARTESQPDQKMPLWLKSLLPDLLNLDKNGQKAVRALLSGLKGK